MTFDKSASWEIAESPEASIGQYFDDEKIKWHLIDATMLLEFKTGDTTSAGMTLNLEYPIEYDSARTTLETQARAVLELKKRLVSIIEALDAQHPAPAE